MPKPAAKAPAPPLHKTRFMRSLFVLIGLLAVGGAIYYFNRPAPVTNEESMVSAPAPTATPAPMTARHIYSETANPKADIAAALSEAKRERKRVIVDFGGDWCGDCQVLDIYFHQPPNAELMARNFVLVHVWIGHMDANLDIPAKYGVPITKGVPALAVLSSSGQTLYAQRTGEFEDMRHMQPDSVTEFLNKWKG